MRRKMPVVAGRYGQRPFPGQLPVRRLCERRTAPVAESPSGFPPVEPMPPATTATLLSGRNHLFKSIKYIPSDYRVKISNDVIYAPIHNWGGSVSVTVTDRMRRFASGQSAEKPRARRRKIRAKRSQGKGDKQTTNQPTGADVGKDLPSPKKKKPNIHIPQRQFLGDR